MNRARLFGREDGGELPLPVEISRTGGQSIWLLILVC